MKIKNTNSKIIITTLALLTLTIAVAAQADWSDPACGPTGCNTATPINVSSTAQTKSGALIVGGLHALTDVNVDDNVHATAFFYTSDKSLKTNIAPLVGSLSQILKLNGVSFSWKKDGAKSIGLVAQDVEQVYPELVATDPNSGLKSVEYGNLVAPLIEAVKTQQQEIEDLQKEVEALKALINK